MSCVRVIVDSQSNKLFRGSPMEQSYDQRGGLCQVGSGDVVVTTDPIDPEYLLYWESLGFQLPHLITAGPYDAEKTLPELIVAKSEVQKQISDAVAGARARLEFFWISSAEQMLAEILQIEPYCNFSVAIDLARKPVFKRLFDELGLPTPPWTLCRNQDELYTAGFQILKHGKQFFVKSEDGTGGIACGGMHLIQSMQDLENITSSIVFLGDEFIVEELVDSPFTVSVHWEITSGLEPRFLGLFDQHAANYGYSGGAWPSDASQETKQRILRELETLLWPWFIKNRAIGYGSCDILIGPDGKHYWTDLNPRKGALIYVRDMVCRLQDTWDPDGKPWEFAHKHVHLPKREHPYSFKEVLARMDSMSLISQHGFVVITNPGVIPHGYSDITVISVNSKEEASECLREALALLEQ